MLGLAKRSRARLLLTSNSKIHASDTHSKAYSALTIPCHSACNRLLPGNAEMHTRHSLRV